LHFNKKYKRAAQKTKEENQSAVEKLTNKLTKKYINERLASVEKLY